MKGNANYLRVAKIVGECLQGISSKIVFIPQHMVVSRTACTLQHQKKHENIPNIKLYHQNNTRIIFSEQESKKVHLYSSMAAEIKVKFGGMANFGVNNSTCNIFISRSVIFGTKAVNLLL